MNKNQGFTLIELLAVVVILAIIMFLSLPVITYNVKNATKSSFENHARMILKNLPYQIAKDANFDLNTVNQTNISSFLKVDTSNYKSIQIEKINEEPYIIIVGANKWNNLVARGTYNNMIVDEGLVLWYDSNIQNELMKREYSKDIWYDLSGNERHGQLNNFSYTETSGWTESGIKFDGIDDRVKTNITPKDMHGLNNDITIMYTIKFDDLNSGQMPLAANAGGQRFYFISRGSGSFGIGLLSWFKNYSNIYLPDEKLYIQITLSKGVGKFYVNGNLIDTINNISGEPTADLIYLGGINTTYQFKGYIYDLKIYNKALTEKEITKNYQVVKNS